MMNKSYERLMIAAKTSSVASPYSVCIGVSYLLRREVNMALRYGIGIVLGLILALLIAPLFPYPASVIFMWIGYVVAIICVILLIVGLVNGGTRTRL